MDQTSRSAQTTRSLRRFFTSQQIILCCLLFVIALPTFAQNLRGRVFDLATGEPVPNVTVENKKSGTQSLTDISGAFSITAQAGDSIHFSQLGYVTQNLHLPQHLARTIIRNVYLSKKYFTIAEVEIHPGGTPYQKDSLEERLIFGKKAEQKQATFGMDKFKYMKGALTFSNPISAPVEHFARKYKRLRAFQKRFKQNEQQGFVETRYTLELITQITGLKGDSLIAFRNQNLLPFGLAASGTDLEVMMWIKGHFKQWIRNPYVPELADSIFLNAHHIPND